jgi:hypothetical protein
MIYLNLQFLLKGLVFKQKKPRDDLVLHNRKESNRELIIKELM